LSKSGLLTARRNPNLDPNALSAVLKRAFGGAKPFTFERTAAGVSTQVYRVLRDGKLFYLRIAEEESDDMRTDAELHRRLLGLGVSVPDVVYVESFDAGLRRSVMITTEIQGSPLTAAASTKKATAVVRAAGRDIALINRVRVDGFGWVKRDGSRWPLAAGFETYAEFVTSELPQPWPGGLAGLFSSRQLAELEEVIEAEKRRDIFGASLAHGDFDLTPIFQRDGRYTGLIDFGEVRGTEPLYDFGHFFLHEGETHPASFLGALLEGYSEVTTLPDDHMDLIRRSGLLSGLRQLCRWIAPERRRNLDHPAARARAGRLDELLAG
jgi:aminoglycoside phosphotransferase (APT) family kinase protein